MRTEWVNAEGAIYHTPKWYFNTCIYIMPILAFGMTIWYLVQSIGWFPDTAWNPFVIQDNIGTCILQWGVVAIVGLVLNKWLNRKTAMGPVTDPEDCK